MLGPSKTTPGLVFLPPARSKRKRSEGNGWSVPADAVGVETVDADGLAYLSTESCPAILCTERLNNVRRLNAFLGELHRRLLAAGKLYVSVETSEQRKARILNKYPRWIAWPYYTLDFVFKRAFPKFKLTRGIYSVLTKNRNRVLSKSEILGRLVFCGFDILGFEKKENLLHITARKRAVDPRMDELDCPMVFKMERVGQFGKLTAIYKGRTMHPYAQFLQDWLNTNHSLKDSGKFVDDFRVATWGRWLRKLWIDELPMLVNLVKGDLKLVGVRPLTPHYLSLYPEDIREERLNHKPGLIPPFYADLPQNFEEIMDSELRYMQAYTKNPFRTDLRYLGLILRNILFKGARSG